MSVPRPRHHGVFSEGSENRSQLAEYAAVYDLVLPASGAAGGFAELQQLLLTAEDDGPGAEGLSAAWREMAGGGGTVLRGAAEEGGRSDSLSEAASDTTSAATPK